MFECGSGWNKLICNLIKDLIDIGWNKEIAQIKEKFGTLRFYPGGYMKNSGNLLKQKEKVLQYVSIVELQKMLNFIQMDGIQQYVNLVRTKIN